MANIKEKKIVLFWIVYILIWLPVKIFFPTRIIGRKNLQKGKGLYACNHQCWADIPILAVAVNRRVYALAKKELCNTKIKNWFFTGIGCIPIDRKEADISSIKAVINVLKHKNKPILIFPQGHRMSSPDELENIKNGVSMFSIKTQSPIYPIVMVKKPRFFVPNKLIIGKPLDLSKYEGRKADKELYSEISQDLTVAMQELLDNNTKKSK